MSNSSHRKKQSSSRHNTQRREIANKGASRAQKKMGKTRRGTVSRARITDMTAELDGQFAATVDSGVQAHLSGEHGQGTSRAPNMQSFDDSVKDLADVLDAL